MHRGLRIQKSPFHSRSFPSCPWILSALLTFLVLSSLTTSVSLSMPLNSKEQVNTQGEGYSDMPPHLLSRSSGFQFQRGAFAVTSTGDIQVKFSARLLPAHTYTVSWIPCWCWQPVWNTHFNVITRIYFLVTVTHRVEICHVLLACAFCFNHKAKTGHTPASNTTINNVYVERKLRSLNHRNW